MDFKIQKVQINLSEIEAFRCANGTLFTLFLSAALIAFALRQPGLDFLPDEITVSRDVKWFVFLFIGITFIYIFMNSFMSIGVRRFIFIIWCFTFAMILFWAGSSKANDGLLVGSALLACVFAPFFVFPYSVQKSAYLISTLGLSFFLMVIVALGLYYFNGKISDRNIFIPFIVSLAVGFIWVISMSIFVMYYEHEESSNCITLVMFPFLAPVDILKTLVD